ncbi:protein WFDC10B-like [Tenrec ecaudatus]|uniref:protein WFDC10B-like n=1 Tax=Tenrec ecaudatus TaxID=94439 RepID=UPI003F59800D
MAARALLAALLLCALLLRAQGDLRQRTPPKPQGPVEIKACEKQPSIYMCSHHCAYHQECQANSVCCSTFCGNVCMSRL